MSATREEQLAAAFVGAADTLSDDFDLAQFLADLAERCVRLLAVDAAGLLLADSQDRLHAEATAEAAAESVTESDTTAPTLAAAHLAALFELDAESGPSAHAFATAATLADLDLSSAETPWPQFALAAMATGFTEAHALPLRLRGTVIGVLSLLCVQPGGLSTADAGLAQGFADVATIGILSRRGLHQAEVLTAQLKTALTSRVIIEQAKGMLAERLQVRIDQAYELMRGHARSHNQPVAQIAREVTEGSEAAIERLRGRVQGLRPDQAAQGAPGVGRP